MFKQMENAGLTDLHFGSDPATGLRAIVAIHSTARGAAIGGCRFIPYDSDEAAINDALRLAKGMSFKAALAGLPHGGGKAVIIQPAGDFDRRELMHSFGRFLNTLGGRYITAMDSGTQISDMDAIAEQTRWVTCTSDIGDPSPHTAQGVYQGIRAAVRQRLKKDTLDGVSVAIQGLGHVGYSLAERLYKAGAELIVSDICDDKVAQAVKELDAVAVAPEVIYQQNCDVFSPCGLGAIINENTFGLLRCKVIAGSANNQLATPDYGEMLKQRGILYAPDYVINSGGLVFVAMQHAGSSKAEISQKIDGIGQELSDLFRQAEQQQIATSDIADQRAERVIRESEQQAQQHTDAA